MNTNTFTLIGSKKALFIMGSHNGISIAWPYVTSTRGESERFICQRF
jgi:hypothetical protein